MAVFLARALPVLQSLRHFALLFYQPGLCWHFMYVELSVYPTFMCVKLSNEQTIQVHDSVDTSGYPVEPTLWCLNNETHNIPSTPESLTAASELPPSLPWPLSSKRNWRTLHNCSGHSLRELYGGSETSLNMSATQVWTQLRRLWSCSWQVCLRHFPECTALTHCRGMLTSLPTIYSHSFHSSWIQLTE